MFKSVDLWCKQNHYKYYFQFIEALQHSFTELGIQCTITHDLPTADIAILIQNVCFILPEFISKLNQYIIYFTEPLYPCIKKSHVPHIQKLVEANPPFAFWHYSKKNMNILSKFFPYIHHSYIPPLYSPIYDYNLSSSPHSFASLIENKISIRLQRAKRIAPTLTSLSAWGHDELRNKLDGFTIVNVHKKPKKNSPLELFRIGPLLSSGISVVSELSYKADMDLFKEFILFVDGSQPIQPHDVIKVNKHLFAQKFNLTTQLKQVLEHYNIPISPVQSPKRHLHKCPLCDFYCMMPMFFRRHMRKHRKGMI